MKFKEIVEKYRRKIAIDFDGTLSSVKKNPNMSMVKKVKELIKNNNVVILTSRRETPISIKEITKFLTKHKIDIEEILFSNGSFKWNVMERESIDELYDDDPEEIKAAKNASMKANLIDVDKNIKDDFEDLYGISY